MARNPTWKGVVALSLRDGEGRFLLQQRALEKHHGGLWEFPGGKVESDELPRLALIREIEEELAIRLDADALDPLGFAEERGVAGNPTIVLMLYAADSWSGEVAAREGQNWGWFTRSEAEGLPLAPMDRRLLARHSG